MSRTNVHLFHLTIVVMLLSLTIQRLVFLIDSETYPREPEPVSAGHDAVVLLTYAFLCAWAMAVTWY